PPPAVTRQRTAGTRPVQMPLPLEAPLRSAGTSVRSTPPRRAADPRRPGRSDGSSRRHRPPRADGPGPDGPLNRYGVLAGRRAVVLTTNDSAYAAAVELHDAGVEIARVAELRDTAPGYWAAQCAERGIPIAPAHAIVGTSGAERVTAAHVAALGGEAHERVDCDLLLVSGGWTPAVHLHSQAGGVLRFDRRLGAFTPVPAGGPMRTVGATSGLLGTAECLRSGA